MDNEHARELITALERQNEMLELRNEMLRESVDQQKESFRSYEEHQAASLEALETPRQLEEMKQQFAQALALWECDVPHIPLRFRQLQELLPDPVLDDDKPGWFGALCPKCGGKGYVKKPKGKR